MCVRVCVYVRACACVRASVRVHVGCARMLCVFFLWAVPLVTFVLGLSLGIPWFLGKWSYRGRRNESSVCIGFFSQATIGYIAGVRSSEVVRRMNKDKTRGKKKDNRSLTFSPARRRQVRLRPHSRTGRATCWSLCCICTRATCFCSRPMIPLLASTGISRRSIGFCFPRSIIYLCISMSASEISRRRPPQALARRRRRRT